MPVRPWISAVLMSLFVFATSAAAQRGPAGPARTTTPPAPRFYYMGPPPNGRLASILGVPGDPSVYYIGASSGGLWKSTDGGHSFAPIFDNQDVAAIGTLAIAPSDPNTLWVGTGEPWIIRNYDMVGDGVYVTHDAGKTFQHMGLEFAGRIARILVHPTDPNTVWVCTEGRLTGPQHDRGVFKTTDGGRTWHQTLAVDDNTGCSGLALDPNHPDTMLAGAWQEVEHTWELNSGGPGSAVYISHDGGESFTRLGTAQGLPHSPLGKIDVAIAPTDGQRMYALIQTADQGSLWRSDDGGAHWRVASWDRSLIGRAGYYIRIAVDPFDENDVLITNSGFHRSIDGGLHFSNSDTNEGSGRLAGGPPAATCGDCHDIWMDPKIRNRFALTDDLAASIATGTEVIPVNLPVGQMYHVSSDNRVPYYLYSNRQDNSIMHIGPSTESTGVGSGRLPVDAFMPYGGAGRGGRRGATAEEANDGLVAAPPYVAADAARGLAAAWPANVPGCESGWTYPDPTDYNVVWESCLSDKMQVYNAKEGTVRSIAPWFSTMSASPVNLKYRCHWTAPIATDPFQPGVAYYGCQLIFKTNDGGQTWTEFSPDLSTKDPSRIVSSGGIEGDNLGQFDGEVVWDIAPSPIQPGLIWAGTNDGKIWYTTDRAGKNWVDVTANLHLPSWGQINAIAPSNFDARTAYAAIDFHLGRDDYKPYIYKTTDMGRTWTNVTGDLPSGSLLDYVMCVAENPNRPGMLFASTAHAFFYSLDDGAHWTKFMQGLPPSPISWINVEKRFHDIDVSTYGRGLYVLPDITVLEQSGQMTPDPAVSRLYAPTDIFRVARNVFPSAANPARPQFILNLATAPSGPMQMDVLDAGGAVIRHEQIVGHAGVNGIDWDLRYDAARQVELRTTPPQNPHIWDEIRFQNADVRPVEHWGLSANTGRPMAAPGKYTLRLTVDGQTFTQAFTVLRDPYLVSTDADLQAGTALQVEMRDNLDTAAAMINQMEIWRKQIEDDRATGNAAAAGALQALDARIAAVEDLLLSSDDMLSDDKHFNTAFKIYSNLWWESGKIGDGAEDEPGGLDYRPTAADVNIAGTLDRELKAAQVQYRTLAPAVAAFNQQMAGTVQAIGDAPTPRRRSGAPN